MANLFVVIGYIWINALSNTLLSFFFKKCSHCVDNNFFMKSVIVNQYIILNSVILRANR